MKIGFDVDNVLVDQFNYQMKYGVPYFEKRGISVKNKYGFDIEDIFECSHAEREKFWTRYIWRYCLKEPMTKDAADISKQLRKNGHEIVIVTGRAHTTEAGITGKLFRWMLMHWLKKNHFEYDDIFYCSESNSSDDKLRVCLEQSIDILIDDKPENLTALKNKLKIICYSSQCNQQFEELDSIRVDNMMQLLDKVSLIESGL